MVSGLGSSDVAGWVQAIGATAGIAIAIWVPYQQRREQVRDEKGRSFNHTLAVVNDLRGRVTFIKNFMTEGGRPLAALTATSTLFFKRYEALYDRDIYTYLPAHIVDRITDMSGSFTGIETAVGYVASKLDNKPHAMLPASDVWDQSGNPFDSLYLELDELFTLLDAEVRKARA